MYLDEYILYIYRIPTFTCTNAYTQYMFMSIKNILVLLTAYMWRKGHNSFALFRFVAKCLYYMTMYFRCCYIERDNSTLCQHDQMYLIYFIIFQSI